MGRKRQDLKVEIVVTEADDAELEREAVFEMHLYVEHRYADVLADLRAAEADR